MIKKPVSKIRAENQLLFKKNQRLLVALANTSAGKYLFGVDRRDKVVQVGPTGVSVLKDTVKGVPILQGDFFCYEKTAKIFVPVLQQIELVKETRSNLIEGVVGLEKAVAQYTGLEPQGLPIYAFVAGDFYAGAGDGFVKNDSETGFGADWNGVRTSTQGNSSGPTSASSGRGIASTYKYSSFFNITREFYPVDLTTIGAGATFTAGVLHVYGEQNDGAGNFVIVAVPTSQASATTLVNDDYDQVSTTQYSNQVTVAFNANQYWDLTLNATALAALVGTGYNKIGVRNYTYDVTGTEPAVNQVWVVTYYSENTGTSKDPYYTLTYTPAPVLAKDNYAFFM